MVNLTHRSYKKELLDGDNIPFEDIKLNMQELNTINSLLGGHGITKNAVKHFIKENNNIHICEIGCGGGDNLQAISTIKNKNFLFTGIDYKRECIDFAKQQYQALHVNWVESDYEKVVFEKNKATRVMSYKNLEIWKEARELSIKIHEMSLTLPKFEQFEEAQQIRRSSKSVRSNIVEGYGRRIYKQDFIKFIIYALSSNDETIDHLETLLETKSLTDEPIYKELHQRLEILGRKINNFLKAVESGHGKPYEVNDPQASYLNPASSIEMPVSNFQPPVSSI